MKVSYQWLSEYVDLQGFTPETLADCLTAGGLAVDAVEARNQGVEGVVVGLVKEATQHSDADRLRVCMVDVGQSELFQIVCGAPNVSVGMKVPVALPGARLPGGTRIKQAKLRGVTSNGMLCSASELGLETRLLPTAQTIGLYVLPDGASLGRDIVTLLHLDDVVLDIDLTPNRSDCLSIRGLAYEIAALAGKTTTFPAAVSFDVPDAPSPVSVRIESDRCARYDAQVVEGVGSMPSPLWMQMRLMAMGVRPIDVIVDITNYVMLEWGQPLHAFDANTIAKGTIVVRQAKDEETLVTLDGQSRKLDGDMLVISDVDKAIGLAGVMGGENSEIRSTTTSVVIESARFDAPSTRRTGQKLGLRSEAQQRFEKGIDPVAVRNALLRTTELLVSLSGARTVGGVVTASTDNDSSLSHTVEFSPAACRQLLGCEIADEQMANIFARLGFSTVHHQDTWSVSIPSRRPDITIPADLAEEIARLYGFDKIPSTLPLGPVTVGTRDARQVVVETVRDALVARGMFEVRTYAFSNPEVHTALRGAEDSLCEKMVPLLHPMSDERRVLRTSLLPSIAEVAHYNLSHRVDGGSIFEIGRVYEAKDGTLKSQPTERETVALLWFGQTEQSLYRRTRNFDFFDAKGVLQHLFAQLGIDACFERGDALYLHPGRSAKLTSGDDVLGVIGELHPETLEQMDVRHAVYAELDVEKLVMHRSRTGTVIPLPRYPGSRRDLAFIVDTETAVGGLLGEVGNALQPLNVLRDVQVFDVYVGQGVPDGQKSVAISLSFQTDDRTLTDEEIDAAVEVATTHLAKMFGAKLRG